MGGIVDEFVANNAGIKILTPSGWSEFAGVVKKRPMMTRTLRVNQHAVTCTNDHKIFVSDDASMMAKHLKIGDSVITANGTAQVNAIEINSEAETVYDIMSVDDGNRFFANGVLISNCEFVTADETLINASTLLQLQGVEPIFKTGQTRWYEHIKPNKTYLVALDPSAGVGKDFSCIQVFSLPDMAQIAEWTHNRTSIPQQVKTLQSTINFIHSEMRKFADQRGDPEIYFTLENNSWGEAAIVTIDEMGEDTFNAIWLHEPKIRGVSRLRRGLNTNVRSKAMACTKLKSLVESNKLVLRSKTLVRQLKFFVAKGNSFEGKVGENDDAVMSTILCVRMMQMVTRWDEAIGNLMKDEFSDESSEPMPISIGY
jgi:hypothetical protein